MSSKGSTLLMLRNQHQGRLISSSIVFNKLTHVNIIELTAIINQIRMDQKLAPHYMGQKAGMHAVDAKAIAEKVAQLTAGTPKDLHEKQLEKKRSLEVSQMLEKVLKFSTQQKKQLKEYWKEKTFTIASSRILNRYWAHLDFDMFYIACQLLQKPQFQQLPCAVGGQQSVLSTANYVARKYGVRSAMPTFIAKKICPELILFKPDFNKYRKFSTIFRNILSQYDENLESHGLDEAYIDITEELSGKSPEQQVQFIQRVRKRIFQQTGLTVSCGVGANKMLAKLASEERKPNNQFILPNNEEEILAYMKNKKIRKIPGIGPVNEYYLKGLGIQTAGDILENTDTLSICFSENTCQFFIEAALGIGSIEHSFKERKSVGKSETFRPTNDQGFLIGKLQQLCEQVSMQMEELGFLSINVILSYQSDKYEKKDKTFKLAKYTASKEVFYEATNKFLRANLHQRFRLLGIRCSALLKEEQVKKQSIVKFFNCQENKLFKAKNKPEEENMEKKQVESVKDVEEKKPEEVKKELTPFEEIKKKGEFICPICNEEISCFRNLGMFNRHVDKCLKSQNQPEPEPPRKESKKRGKSKQKTEGIEAFIKRK